jgi:hypothetical protein
MLDLDHLAAELTAAADDAGIRPGSLAVFVVDGARPAGTTPMAYLHPAGHVWPDTVSVFRSVERELVEHHHLAAHRLALWGELPGVPAAALGIMLRHELEHARRWERSGTPFFEADELLRVAVRNANGAGYGGLPSELEANAASTAYAACTLRPPELDELRACADTAALVDAPPPPGDVVEATLAELAGRSDWAPWLDARERSAYLAEARSACAAWPEGGGEPLGRGRRRPEVERVSPVREP